MSTNSDDRVVADVKSINCYAQHIARRSEVRDQIRYYLRPTRSGVTVVSTDAKTPMCGFTGWNGQGEIPWKTVTSVADPQKKPEKRVQAQLIRMALEHERRLPAVFAPTGTVWFLVDEFVAQTGDSVKDSVRGDMIGIWEVDGAIRPAFIEIKWDRQADTLKKQINKMYTTFFNDSAKRRLQALHDLATTVLGRPLPPWSPTGARALGVMVWPQCVSPRRKTPGKTDLGAGRELQVVGYNDGWPDHELTFVHESSLA